MPTTGGTHPMTEDRDAPSTTTRAGRAAVDTGRKTWGSSALVGALDASGLPTADAAGISGRPGPGRRPDSSACPPRPGPFCC